MANPKNPDKPDDFDEIMEQFFPAGQFVPADLFDDRLQKIVEQQRLEDLKKKQEAFAKRAAQQREKALNDARKKYEVKPPAKPEPKKLDLNANEKKQKTFFRTVEIKGRKFEITADAPISDVLVKQMVEHYQEAGVFHKPQVFQFDDQYEDGDLPFHYPNPFGSPKMTQHQMFKTNEVQLEQVGDKLEVKIAYNLSFISAIKSLPKSTRHFDPKKKLWVVSVSQITGLESLLKAAGADFVRFKPKSFDLYEVLGVNSTATQDEIKKAYYVMARKCHPDVCRDFNAREKYEFIKQAYDVLRNPGARKKYDFVRNISTRRSMFDDGF